MTQIIDEYSLYAISSITNDHILVEFESVVDYKADSVLQVNVEINKQIVEELT